MTTPARDAYLTTQVMTATPQKLQLLLIDAAIRSIQQGERHWSEGNDEAASESLTHATEVIAELLAGVGSAKSEISRRLASLYLYLFHTLTEAHLQHNEQKLSDVLKILHIERETWSMVCEKFGARQEGDASSAPVMSGVEETSTGLSEATPDAEESPPMQTNIHASHPTLQTKRSFRGPIGAPMHDMHGNSGSISLEA